jgi:type VI secretion system secreted protein Hcp
VAVDQVDYFLKIDGIDGESTDDQHQGEIDIESWSWGEVNPAPRSGGGLAKVQMQDIHCTMRTSKASPKLMLACASGQHIKTAQLTGRWADRARLTFLTVALNAVLVSSFECGAASPQAAPMDQITLNFTTIEVTYQEQNPDGSPGPSTTAGWDTQTNKPA